MCGIVGVFDLKVNYLELKASVLKMSKKIRHRGPDWSGIFCCEKAILTHERLSMAFLPLHYNLYSMDGVMKRWYQRDWMHYVVSYAAQPKP